MDYFMEYWRPSDMQVMAYAFARAPEAFIRRGYDPNLMDTPRFLEDLCRSGMRSWMDDMHIHLMMLAGLELLDTFIREDLEDHLESYLTESQQDVPSYDSLFWCGEFVTYMRYYTMMRMDKLMDVMPIRETLSWFGVFHQMDMRNCAEKVVSGWETP